MKKHPGLLVLAALVYLVSFLGAYVALVITGHPTEANAVGSTSVGIPCVALFFAWIGLW